MRKILAAAVCAFALAGCTGVIDNCHEGLNAPPGGWASPQPH